MWTLLEDDKALAVKNFAFHTRDSLKLEMEIVEGPTSNVKLCDDAELSENVYDSDVCEYKCTNAEAHSVSLLSSMETYMISCHDTSWYFTVIQRSEKKKNKQKKPFL